MWLQAGLMLEDVDQGDELLIQYGTGYFDIQRAKIAHSVRSALEAWSMRKSLERAHIKTTMKLLAIIESVRVLRHPLISSVSGFPGDCIFPRAGTGAQHTVTHPPRDELSAHVLAHTPDRAARYHVALSVAVTIVATLLCVRPCARGVGNEHLCQCICTRGRVNLVCGWLRLIDIQFAVAG